MSERLQRLLGPGRPELTCEECFHELDWYADRVLGAPGAQPALCSSCRSPEACRDASACLGMEAHLEGCPACAEEFESLVALLGDDS
jgi:hypothetical protein